MDWIEVAIKTKSEGIDRLTDELDLLGYDSLLIDDEADFLQFLEQNRQYWDYVDEKLAAEMHGMSRIRLYFQSQAEVETLKKQLTKLHEQYGAALGELSIETRPVRDEDWENSWKQYYKPVKVGDRFLIVPKWLDPEIPEGRLPILLDPGMIFGTGTHASTQMCLRALERTIRGGERVLDLGSGSGILSIAALRLGAKDAIGVDIDPQAEHIARDNAALNGMDERCFTALTGNVLGDDSLMRRIAGKYDVVLANIVADVIIPLTEIVPALLKETGVFLCSGVLNTRLREVTDAIEKSGLRIRAISQQEDWCQITADRG